MNKSFDLKELVPVIREQLDAGKTVQFVPNGSSMRPMLTGGEDIIMLRKPEGRLHMFDVAMYYRKETDKYVVHRVVGFRKDGTYVFLGDNNMEREYGISDEDIVGVVVSYYHKGRMRNVTSLSYRSYCNFWYYTRPVRCMYRMGKIGLARRIKK